MRLVALCLLLLPTICSSRIPPVEHYSNAFENSPWETDGEVNQPKAPKARATSYGVLFFNWTTNKEKFVEWNAGKNSTISKNNHDYGIDCKTDKERAVIRLIPAAVADSCNYAGGIVARCPDFNVLPVIYAHALEPGDYVLTSFSDGTDEGVYRTSGGYCAKGFKFPITIIDSERDYASHVLPMPATRSPPVHQPEHNEPSDYDYYSDHVEPSHLNKPSSASHAYLSIAILVLLILQ